MGPEGSLPFHNSPPLVRILSQINSFHVSHTISWKFMLILSSHPRTGFPSGLFPSGFPTKTLYATHVPPYVPHALPISFFLIRPPIYLNMPRIIHDLRNFQTKNAFILNQTVLINKSVFKIQYLQATFHGDLACTLSASFLIYQS